MKDRSLSLLQHRAPALLGAIAPLLCAAGMLALGACGTASSHEMGSTHEGDAPEEPFFTEGEGFTGRWLGQAREPLAIGVSGDQTAPSYVFPSGSSSILLTIEEAPDSTDPAMLGGTLTFGEGTPPPPAERKDLGYPEGFDYMSFLSYPEPTDDIRNYADEWPPLEGYGYALESSSFEEGVPDGVLRLHYDTRSFLDTWCRKQAPHEQPDGSYGALPFAAGGSETPVPDGKNRSCSAFGAADLSACPDDLNELPYDEYVRTYGRCQKRGPVVYSMSCDRIFLTQFCSCTDAACSVRPPARAPSLMLRTAGNSLIGIFTDATFLNARGLSLPVGEVRFRRTDD
jgi:hypothetical protein